ncbi:LIM/homeobox protein LMX-1.2 [Blomia tropicalis]|nr:LIM/homeobox protein LMX-1.2 [Blomia tropicalis]
MFIFSSTLFQSFYRLQMLSSPPPAPSLGSEHHHRVTSPSDLSASAVIPSIGQFGSDLSATFHVSESVHDQHLHSHSQHRSQLHHQHHHNRLQSFAVDGNGEGQSPIPNPILDRYLACISPECYWHEQCLQCAVCRILLTRSCYVKERKLYCKHDYNK